MTKLINSSSSELRIKYHSAVRAGADMVLIIMGFITGVLTVVIAVDDNRAVWAAAVVLVAATVYWLVRAFLIYRIARARQRGWDATVEQIYEQHRREPDDGSEPTG